MEIRNLMFLCLLFSFLLPLNAQNNSEKEQKYKVAACDWMMLKRQKIGSFKLMNELGGDGVEMDMGGLGKRDTFDNKLRQPEFQKLFKETAAEFQIEVPSVAMSGFYGQSFLTHSHYKALVQDCLNTMRVMGSKVAYLPLGGIKEDWRTKGEAREELIKRLHEIGEMATVEGMVVGIRTGQDAKSDIKLLREINSKGIKIYYSFQDALENGRNLCKELQRLGKERICQIHCSDTDGVTLPYNSRLDMKAVKKTLDRMRWSGWLVIERSRNKDEVRDVKKNFRTNITYLKEVFQSE